MMLLITIFFFSSRRRHTRCLSDWSSDVCSSDLWSNHNVRPAMLLAGANVAEVRELIDRGIASDFTYPGGTGYLARTSDPMRNVRAAGFAKAIEILGRALDRKSTRLNSSHLGISY